jgi:DNA-directed RNA polymerase specialized sigma24 family protein
VQQAWVKALSNPETKRPSTENFEQFVTYMCTLAKYEAMTNHQFFRRQEQRHVPGETDIAEWVVEQNALGATEARLVLESSFLALEPDEQALLHALYHDGKTIEEIKEEQGLAWSTLDYRKKQILNRLYAALQALVATLLLAPKKARAFVAHASQNLPQLASTMTVTAVCGGLLPTSSSLATERSNLSSLTQVESTPTDAMKTAGLSPSVVPEVAPEEPKEVDTATNACSAGDMKCTKTASSVVENLMPMTFVLGVALAQAACAGSQPQTLAAQQAQQAEEDDEPREGTDPYDGICEENRRRGEKCMTREEYRKWLGDD